MSQHVLVIFLPDAETQSSVKQLRPRKKFCLGLFHLLPESGRTEPKKTSKADVQLASTLQGHCKFSDQTENTVLIADNSDINIFSTRISLGGPIHLKLIQQKLEARYSTQD